LCELLPIGQRIPGRIKPAQDFRQGHGQVSMFMAGVGELHQGEAFQFF
jgi:hypothetical protein